jgi:hypothetical protein
MYIKSILIILFIIIVSAKNLNNENKTEVKALQDSNEVLKTLIKKITAIKADLENAVKSLFGTDLLNKIEEKLLSLLSSIHSSIGHEHSLLAPLNDLTKQVNDALVALKTLLDENGDSANFVDKFIVPLIPTLKNLIPKLNELIDSGIGGEHEAHHGGIQGGNHGGIHGGIHGGNHEVTI